MQTQKPARYRERMNETIIHLKFIRCVDVETYICIVSLSLCWTIVLPKPFGSEIAGGEK